MSLKQKVTTSLVCSALALLALVTSQEPELKTSEQGLAHILDAEGCRLAAYQCSADKWSIGAGHTRNVTAQDNISLEQAAEFFIDDVQEAEAVVKRHITRPASQGEWDMMVSFVFNLGAGNFERSTLLKQFNQGNSAAACDEYLRWVYVNGQNCRLTESNCAGIVKRRAIEQDVCLNGWAADK